MSRARLVVATIALAVVAAPMLSTTPSVAAPPAVGVVVTTELHTVQEGPRILIGG